MTDTAHTRGTPAAAGASATRKAETFDAAQRRLLAAVVDRILPSDDGFGAAEAGCAGYVLQALEARLAQTRLARVVNTLEFLDDLAVQMGGAPFADLPPAEQDGVLRQLQRTPHPTAQDFIHRMVSLTLEGFLCDPRHGGNRGRIGWRYIAPSAYLSPLGGEPGKPPECTNTTS